MINKIKGKKSKENIRIKTIPISEVPTGKTMPIKQNNELVVIPLYEENDEEWLRKKHRILDIRTEQRNRNEIILNMNSHQLYIQLYTNTLMKF